MKRGRTTTQQEAEPAEEAEEETKKIKEPEAEEEKAKEKEDTKQGAEGTTAKEEEAGLDANTVHVRSNGKVRTYAEYALKQLNAATQLMGACVTFAGVGNAAQKTVASVELTKALFAEQHSGLQLVQHDGTISAVTIGERRVPRLVIVLMCQACTGKPPGPEQFFAKTTSTTASATSTSSTTERDE